MEWTISYAAYPIKRLGATLFFLFAIYFLLFNTLAQANVGEMGESGEEIIFRSIVAPPGHLKAVFDSDENQLTIGTYRGDQQYFRALSVDQYDLSSSQQRQEAIDRLIEMGFYDDLDEETLIGDVHNCYLEYMAEDILPTVSSNFLDDIEDVLDNVYEQYLSDAVAQRIDKVDDQNFYLDLRAFETDMTVHIHLDEDGEIIEISWVDEEAVKELGLEIVQRRNPETGILEFQIVHPESELPFFILRLDGPAQDEANLEVLVLGRKTLDQFHRDAYEKNTFEMREDFRGTSFMERVRLDGQRSNVYDIEFSSGGKRGFRGAIFRLLHGSTESRQEKVRDTIIDEARATIRSSPSYQELISEDDISLLADEISEIVREQTDDFSDDLGMITAVAKEQAFSRFAEIILRRTVDGMVEQEDQEDIEAIIEKTLAPFRDCLAGARELRDEDGLSQCMDAFEKEGPVDVGREILDLKLVGNGLDRYRDYYNQQYNSCIQEKYDVLHTSYRVDQDAPLSVVQACVFDTFVLTVDRAVPGEIQNTTNEMNPPLNLTSSQNREILEYGRNCLRERGLISHYDEAIIDTNYSHFLETNAKDFEESLRYCVDEYTYRAGGLIVEQVIHNELNENLGDNSISDVHRERIVATALERGHNRCRDIQYDFFHGSDIEDRKYDPIRCESIIKLLAISLSTEATIRSEVGEELWERMASDYDDIAGKCFEDSVGQSFADLESSLNSTNSEDELNESVAELENRSEVMGINCLRRAMGWAAGPVTLARLNEGLEGIQESFGEVDFSDEQLINLAGEVEQCFVSKLDDYQTIDDLMGAQEELANYCALKMLRGEQAQRDIFRPLMAVSLENAGMNEDEVEVYSDMLVGDFLYYTSSRNTLDDFLNSAEEYRPRAILSVVDAVLNDYIKGSIGDDVNTSEGREFVSQVVEHINEEVMENAGFRESLIAASESEDPDELGRVVDELKIAATREAAGFILEREARKLHDQGILKEEDIAEFISYGENILNRCFDDNMTRYYTDDLRAHCEAKLKEESILWVVNTAVDREISDPAIIGLIGEERAQALKSEIINDELRSEVSLAARIDDPAESQAAMDRLIRDIGNRGVQTIAPPVLRESLNKNLSLDEGDYNHPVITLVEQKLFECFESVDSSENAPSSEGCVNLARSTAMVEIFSGHLNGLVPMLNTSNGLFELIVQDHVNSLESCLESIGVETNMSEYEQLADVCIRQEIVAAADEIVPWLESELKDREYIPRGTSLNARWQSCRSELVNEYADVPLDEYQSQLMDCLYSDIAPALVGAFGEGFSMAMRRQGHWTEREQALFQSIAYNARELMENEPSIAPVLIGQGPADTLGTQYYSIRPGDTGYQIGLRMGIPFEEIERANPGVNWMRLQIGQEIVIPSSGETTNTRRAGEQQNLWELLDELGPDLGPHLSGLINFGDPGLNDDIERLFERIRHRASVARDNGEELEREDIYELVLDSPLSDYLIQSVIASEVRETAEPALREFIPDPHQRAQVVARLSSPGMIRSIFPLDDQLVIDMFDTVKRDYVMDMLNGEAPAEIPEHIMRPIKLRMATDIRREGFAETIFEPIVQPQLDEAKGTFGASVGRLFGVVSSNDFQWSELKHRPGSRNVIDQFSQEILAPVLVGGGMTPEQMQWAEQRLEGVINDLVRNR